MQVNDKTVRGAFVPVDSWTIIQQGRGFTVREATATDHGAQIVYTGILSLVAGDSLLRASMWTRCGIGTAVEPPTAEHMGLVLQVKESLGGKGKGDVSVAGYLVAELDG
jgi:hypothetical protein